MEKDVSRWLHHQLGYNAAADSTLSASCKGNLKKLWDFLLANYKTHENQRQIQHALAKHRQEQEIARLAPQQQAEALEQKQQLHQLDARLTALHRTLASLQSAVQSSIQDDVQQACEQHFCKQELQEAEIQALLLKAYKHRCQQLLPELQAKLSKLQFVADAAKARKKTGSDHKQRHTGILKRLQQLNSSIQHELTVNLEQLSTNNSGNWMQPHYQQSQPTILAAADSSQHHDQHTGHDHASADQHVNRGSSNNSSSNSSNIDGYGNDTWQVQAAAGVQQLVRCSQLISNYSPSEHVQSVAIQLLQEQPAHLVSCCSTLAAQACQELAAVLEEAEAALLAPLQNNRKDDSLQDITQQHYQQRQLQGLKGLLGAPAAEAPQQGVACLYTLPWATNGAVVPGTAAGVTAEPQAPELLVKQRQQMHIQLFVQAKAARASAKAADKELTRLLGSILLLQRRRNSSSGSSWDADLARLWLQAGRLRGELSHLEQRKTQFEQDVSACLQAEEQLQENWRDIEARVAEDANINRLLWQVASDNMELFAALCCQQDVVHEVLQHQLVPHSCAAVRHAGEGRDLVQEVVKAIGQLPTTALAGVQPLAMQEANTTVGQQPTVRRLQLAAHRLTSIGRPTSSINTRANARVTDAGVAAGQDPAAGGSVGLNIHNSSSSVAADIDAAAVAALRAAAAVDAVASARCPAGILLDVADDCKQVQQLQCVLEQLSALQSVAAAAGRETSKLVAHLSTKVSELRMHDEQEVLPHLHSLTEQVQQQRAFAGQQVAQDIDHYWQMPAQHLLPGHKYEGKSCSEWLMELQALHGRRRQLSSHIG